MKKCDDEDYLIADVDDNIILNIDDNELEVIMTDDVDIEEKLEQIENLKMFTGIAIMINIIINNMTFITNIIRKL